MERFKRLLQAYVRFVQKVLLTVFLTLSYVFGFAATWLLLLVFNRRLLFPDAPGTTTTWTPAERYSADPEECTHPS